MRVWWLSTLAAACYGPHAPGYFGGGSGGSSNGGAGGGGSGFCATDPSVTAGSGTNSFTDRAGNARIVIR